MARNPNTRAEATVTLNGKQAEQVLNTLRQKAKDFKDEIKKAEAAGDGKLAEKLRRELNAVEASIRNVQRATFDYSKVLRNINGASLRDLEKTARLLNAEIKKLDPNTKQFIERSKQLEQVRKRMQQLNQAGREHAGVWERMTNGFNKYFGIVTTLVASITGLSFTMRKLNEEAAKMDDTYSDVMKTTEMTRDEVLELNEAFKNLNTRTSRQKLNELARDAGKLGKRGKQDILDFVEAGNQINVALGEDLGEDAIKQIGKMVGVYSNATEHLQKLDLKGQMLAVGSAVNELGASSTASEKYLVAFAGRLGGVSKQAKISIADILGFASALDQDMQQVEMSATAFQKFIMKLMADPAEFARMAGLEVKSFTELLEKDTNQAIITVLRALNEKGGFQQLIPIFKDMGMDGARAVGVLSSMAGSIDKVTTAQEVSNRALQEGVSITNEYNIKNENNMAKLEKARKKFKDMAIELGEKLNPAFIKFTNSSTMLIKLIQILIDFFGKYGGTIVKLTSIVLAYTLAIKAHTLWEGKLKTALSLTSIQLKLKRLALVANRAAALLYSAAVNLLSGNITKANHAFKLFAATLKAHPIGLLAGIITAVGVALYTFINRTEKAAQVSAEFAKELTNERTELDKLFDAAKNSADGSKERAEAIKLINEKYKDYLPNLLTEKSSLEEIEKAQNAATKAMAQRLSLAAQQKQIEPFEEKLTDAQKNFSDAVMKTTKKLSDAQKGVFAARMEELKKEVQNWDMSNQGNLFGLRRKVSDIFSEVSGGQTIGSSAYQNMPGKIAQLIRAEKNLENQTESLKTTYDSYLKTLGLVDDAQEKTTKVVDPDKDSNKNTNPNPALDTDDKELEKLYKKRLAILEAAWNTEKLKQQEAYLKREITHQQYLNNIAKADRDYYNQKADLEKEFGKSDAESRMKALEHMMKQAQAIDKAFEDSKKAISKFVKDVEKDLNNFDVAKSLKSEMDEVDKDIADFLKNQEEKIKRQTESIQKFTSESLEKKRDADLQALNELNEENKISEQDYIDGLIDIWGEYFSKYAKMALKAIDVISGLTSAFEEAETARMNAEYEKRLTAAGDNAEEREKIEEERAKEEIEIKKKYADSTFALQTLQISVTGLVTAWEAYSALAGIPIVGPALGAAAAAAVAITTAAQIAKAKAERDKVKNISYSGKSSGGSSDSSQRVLLPGLEEGGRLTVEREQDGKLFNADLRPSARGYIGKPTVLVGESGNEFVANNDAVNNPTVKPVLDIIDIAQKHGTIATLNLPAVLSTSKVQGRESGGSFTTPGGGSSPSGGSTSRYVSDPELVNTLKEVKEVLSILKNQTPRAYIVYADIEKAEKVKKQSDELGNLN